MRLQDADLQLFYLDDFIDKLTINYNEIVDDNCPVYLLSQIKGLDSEIIQLLERSGIYDTEDFKIALPHLNSRLQLEESVIETINMKVKLMMKKAIESPSIILRFPENYALITAFNDRSVNYLGVHWRGLTVKLSKSRESYWNPIKFQLEELLKKMNNPEMIGRVQISNPPHWLDQVIPISTYISNLSFDVPIIEIALEWGLDTSMLNPLDKIEQQLLSLLYLVKYSKNSKLTKSKTSS